MVEFDFDFCLLKEEIIVLYDGVCLLCWCEVGVYQCGVEDVLLCFCDISCLDLFVIEFFVGMMCEQLLVCFYVCCVDGVVFSGVEVFVKLWVILLGWCWLVWLVCLFGMLWLMECSYCGFLCVCLVV